MGSLLTGFTQEEKRLKMYEIDLNKWFYKEEHLKKLQEKWNKKWADRVSWDENCKNLEQELREVGDDEDN